MKNAVKNIKILLAAVIAAVMLLPFTRGTAWADSEGRRVVLSDDARFLTDSQRENVENLMQKAADAARCDVGIFTVSVKEVKLADVDFNEMVTEKFGENGDVIALLFYDGFSTMTASFEMCMRGSAVENFKDIQNALHRNVTKTAESEGIADAFGYFCSTVEEHGKAVYASMPDEEKSEEKSEYANSSDKILTKGTEWKAALADFDDCLTAAEEREVLDYMEESARDAKCNIGIIITRDLGGMYARKYTEKFLDDNFGITSDSAVLMLLNRHNNPEYKNTEYYKDWISLSGKAEQKLQKHKNKIFDDVYDRLDDNGSIPNTSYDQLHFRSACIGFCNSVRIYSGFGFRRVIKLFVENPLRTLMSVVVAIVLTMFISVAVIGTYKKKKPLSAARYIDRGSVHVTHRRDDFIREYTTSVHINRSSGGGGHSSIGGGGGHHGGGGGRSR